MPCEHQRDAAALDRRRRRAGVEVEHERASGARAARRAASGTCSSSAARFASQTSVAQVVGEQCSRSASCSLGSVDRAHPLGPVRGRLLLEERLALDPVGPARDGQRAAVQVGTSITGAIARSSRSRRAWSNPVARVQHLVEVRELQLAAVDGHGRAGFALLGASSRRAAASSRTTSRALLVLAQARGTRGGAGCPARVQCENSTSATRRGSQNTASRGGAARRLERRVLARAAARAAARARRARPRRGRCRHGRRSAARRSASCTPTQQRADPCSAPALRRAASRRPRAPGGRSS